MINLALFNWVDLVIIALLLLFAIEGIGRSFINETLDFGSFLLAFFLSLRFYNQTSAFLSTKFNIPYSFANVLGFVAIWFLVELALFLFLHLFFDKLKFIHKLDHSLKNFSVVPSFLRGLVLISIFILFLSNFPLFPRLKKDINDSQIGSAILAKTSQIEQPLKSVFGGITKDTLNFFTVEPKSTESVNLGFKTTQFHPDDSLENQMIDLVNKERAQRGLKILTFDPNLREIGREHSSDMFERGYFSHYSPEGKSVADRANTKGIYYLVIGENLAYAPNLTLAHNGLMNSPGHRANILSVDYNKIGIGIMDGGIYGLMITQVFSN